jgi:flagellar hook protein FlgE
MGLTSAMYIGLTGLNTHQARIETIGHNIANVNTNAFKGSRTLFQTLFSQTLSPGTPPGADSGGTNPMQIGKGVAVGSTQRTTTLGAIETTGLPSDVALEGAGYFVVTNTEGRRFYTRDGSFVLNAQNELVTPDGHHVQGYGVDEDFTVIPGVLTDISLPIGEDLIARATRNVALEGVLSASELAASAGSEHSSQAMVNGGGAPADAGSALTDLRSGTDPATLLFADGDVITLSGAARGERDVPAQQFTVGTTGSTLGDLATWMQNALTIQDVDGVPGNPGVVVENGALVVRGNAGTPNAISIQSSDVTSSNATVGVPFTFTQTAQAEGGGVFTAFTIYDTLGNPVTVNATFTLDSTPNTGPVWRYYLETAELDGMPQLLGTGTVAFDTEGNFSAISGDQFTIDRSGTGADSPLTFTLDLTRLNGLSTRESAVVLNEQDGYPPGTLTAYSIGLDGIITGVFSNGLSHTLGQLVLSMFPNEIGLVAEADNLFTVGPNSGEAQIVEPGTLGSGTTRAGALEMSNVDLTREFIGLITTSTGFQANSRVISVSGDMLDQLMLMLR